MATSVGASNATTAIQAWSTQWQQEALTTPCGSCTGRACTVCSIRVGGAAKADGTPSGYAAKVLDYYNSASDVSAGIDPLVIDLSAMAAQGTTISTPETAARTVSFSDAASATSNGTAALAPVQNAIVLENMKQGTPESVWLIGQADSSIEGYAAQFTSDHGQRVDFKINTDATNYRVDVYRLGYYNGDGARLVSSFTQNLGAAQVQPVPFFDPTTKLVDAGNWLVSASWDIPPDAVSGVYFAELTRLDTGGQNLIPFIVRDDEAPSDITFQTSDTTWQAYNWWGGYNFYGGIDEGGRIGRASAVSYNRPIITRDGGFSAGPQDFIFGEEYPAIRWLEENGYDVNYISGIDTARDGAQLLNSKIFLSVGHDEYWSASQRSNVEAARDAGVNLAFMSGNEVYWETRWESSIDGTGTPYKTLVSYKETWSNADTDPGNTTGTWRDPQYGAGQPENALTGTIFTVDSYRLDTITIPYDLSNFRFWSNTAIADIQPGQVYSLTPNLLGYEWDSDLDNGYRPAGLVALSSTTVDVNTLLLDYGSTTGAGTASHSLTLYRAPSGALVFGAGTVYWSWGLDSHHDNEATPTDPNVQQAMVNLFADMGVQPQTLMQSLAVAAQTTDLTAPTSVITLPTAGGSYAAASPITITGTATDAGGGSVAVVEVSTDGGITWHRASGFDNWTYTFVPLAAGTYHIESRAVDDSVNLETPGIGKTITISAAPTASFFSLSDTPQILSDPDGAFVNLGLKFSSSQAGSIVAIRYYKGLGDGGSHIGALWSSTGTLLASATFTQETSSGWQTVTFAQPVTIAAGVSYIASYHSNGHYADTDSYFTGPVTSGRLTLQGGASVFTYSQDLAFPTTSSTSGTNYWVDVVYSAVVPINQAPIGMNDAGFVLERDTPITIAASLLLGNDTDANGDVLSISGVGSASGGSVSYDTLGQTVTFTPGPGYTGAASFGYAISDGHGGIGSAQVSLNILPPVTNATIFSNSDAPANFSDADPSQVNLGVRFVSSSNGVITGIRYYKGANDTGTHTGSLWSSTGVLLATATFMNETNSGWQQLTFSSPVSITANATYIASYHSNGHYTSTPGYFGSSRLNGVLTALGGGLNGLYGYGSANLFPTETYGATNYWVDVSFSSSAGAVNQSPIANNDNGLTTPQNNTLTIAASALLANDTDPDGDTLTITGAGLGVNGSANYFSNTKTVTFTPVTGYTGPASFTYSISDGHGGTAQATVNLTITPATNNPPIAVSDSGYTTQPNTAITIAASALLTNDTDADGDSLVVTGASGGINGTVAFNAQTNIITFTPLTNYTGPASFSYSISDGHGGTSTANVSLNVTAPVNHTPVAVADSFSTTQNTTLTISASSLLTNDTDADGDALMVTGLVNGSATNGTATFNVQTGTFTFTPFTDYAGPAAFQYAISDGRGGTAAATVNVTINMPTASISLFSASNTPAVLSDPDPSAVNLGVRFVSSAAGIITGIKYYKSANDTGTHTGSLWTSSGTLLATSTFTAETSSGWQTVTFSNPVSIAAGTTYVASYESNGHYTNTSGYFTSSYTNGPLTAPVNAGVYTYGASNLLPSSSYGAANYWIDVTFSASVASPNQSPTALNDGGFNVSQNTPLAIPASTLLTNDSDPDGDTLTITGVSGGINGTATFNSQTNTVTFSPNSGYTGAASFNYAISDGRGGTASATTALSVNPATTSIYSLFSPSLAPGMVSVADPNPVELGFKFQASANGDIVGLQFYKGAQNVGAHVADLWSASGTLLASATFTNETTSGWQQVNFSAPVSITAGTTYVASYHTSGNYSADPNLFASAVTNGPLTGLASSTSGGNGVYAYGSGSLFPTNSYNSTSYGVDVLFRAQLAA